MDAMNMAVDESNVVGPIGELKAHAHLYADAGLEVFPLRRDKSPATDNGFKDATTDHTQIDKWWTRNPEALIGHRIAAHHLVLDIDPRHGGLSTWAALKLEIGGWPVTRVHRSGRNDGGGHTWWQRPDDKLTITKLDEWARERGVGHRITEDRWTCGIDILHHDLRYTILPPSPHPDTQQPYHWHDGRGIDITPAPMPALLADLLVADTAPPPAPRAPRPADPDSIIHWYNRTHTIADLLTGLGWTCVAGDGNQDGSRWRHPAATSACSATVRNGSLYVYTTSTVFDPTSDGAPRGYDPFDIYSTVNHRGNDSQAAAAARELKDGPSVRAWINTIVTGAPAATGQRPASEPADLPSLHIPDVVWDSRAELAHIRQAARARLVAPDAVLGGVLTRLAAITPHTVELPATVGSAVGLTYFTALVGNPEAGKSAAAAVAAELVPAPAEVLDRLPVGSGEGMVEILFDYVEEEDENGKKRKVKRQVRWQAIFQIDEGQALADLGQRSGSTLMPTLRSAWTHGTLGNANASIERRRILDGVNYVYGVSLGIQPELAGPLLADTNGGTPQRFLWLHAADPDAADTDWPGDLGWQPPTAVELEPLSVTRRSYRRHQLDVAPQIVEQLREHRRGVLTGTVVSDPGDAHRGLLQLKTAALLALLDGRVNVDLEDWHLADLICDTNRSVRRHVESTLAWVAAKTEQAASARIARREIVVGEVHESKALSSAAKSVANVVHKHHEAGEHDQPGCPQRCLTLAIKGAHRKHVTTDEAANEATRNGWLTATGSRWLPGESRPA